MGFSNMKISNKGLKIIQKYDPEAEINIGHDQIWVGDYETSYNKMTDVEKKFMEEDDWFEADDSWSHFV